MGEVVLVVVLQAFYWAGFFVGRWDERNKRELQELRKWIDELERRDRVSPEYLEARKHDNG